MDCGARITDTRAKAKVNTKVNPVTKRVVIAQHETLAAVMLP